jgi:hypothetical protein
MTLLDGPKAVAPKVIQPVRWSVKDFVLIHSERGLTNDIERAWSLLA